MSKLLLKECIVTLDLGIIKVDVILIFIKMLIVGMIVTFDNYLRTRLFHMGIRDIAAVSIFSIVSF